MSVTEKLSAVIQKNNSLLCIGLDPDISKLPAHIASLDHSQFEFNKAIIDATHDLVCGYKPNTAFYEARGAAGIEDLKMTFDYINATYPDVVTILDAKRADIGNTNEGYVTFAFEYLKADAITLHPYLGKEALQPFLDRSDKACIILCKTSNPGSDEFQNLVVGESSGEPLYKKVAAAVSGSWNGNGNCMLVVGATYRAEIAEVRKIVGESMVLLIPGVGAQGGDVKDTVIAAKNTSGTGMMINSARGIIFAGNGEDFAEKARAEAQKLRDEINSYR